MRNIVEFLQIHGKTIGDKAEQKDDLCMKIISTYKMHHKCPGDPGIQGILDGLVEEYRKREGL